MVKFDQIRPFKALVLGDFNLDTYTRGKVKRISPEAPVPVMEVESQESRPGCAGNVVLNLLSLGGEVTAVGRIGDDAVGDELKKRLGSANTELLYIEPGYKTPVKNRLIAQSQQLLRIDFETIVPASSELELKIIKALRKKIHEVQVVAISDYGKGFLTNQIIANAIEIAKSAKIPVIVDPKGLDFAKYKGASILKPNLSEAYAAAKLSHGHSLEQVAQHLIALADQLLITRSELGMTLFDSQLNRFDFPSRPREVRDVTGAGDTVLAVLCLALANGLDLHMASMLANVAAGISVEKVGCAQISLSELAERLLEMECEVPVFDERSAVAMTQVLQGKRYSLFVGDLKDI